MMRIGTINEMLMRYDIRYLGKMLSLCVILGLLGLPSCSRIEPAPGPDVDTPVRLAFSVDRAPWGVPATKAGEDATSWSDGASIFFALKSDDQMMTARACYNSGSDSWYFQRAVVQSDGFRWESVTSSDLAPFSSGNCICYYFEDSSGNFAFVYTESDNMNPHINLDATYAIYADQEARYGIADGVLSITAHLTPITGRIRFTPSEDNPWAYPKLYGLRWYKHFDLSTFELTSSTNVTATVYINTGDTFSRYIYGSFVDPANPVLTLYDERNGSYFYEHGFTENILTPGRSNWFYVPTNTSHNEWYLFDSRIDQYKLGVSSLNMLYVLPGTFMMGGEDAGPIHQVTLSHGYYLGETEVTRNTWYIVMGEPSNWVDSEVPVTNKTWDEIQEFIVRLNSQTGYNFRLPTEAEWEFAARGALRTNGYKYSGSDTMAEVAVHDSDVKSVKTRDANEWGFYDMSGNAAEWVSDWMGEYPDGAVVDPAGPKTGDAHITRGGESYGGEYTMTVSYRNRRANMYRTGFRLALDAPKIQ